MMFLENWNRKSRRFTQRLKRHPRIVALIIAASLSGAMTCSWECDNFERSLPQAVRVLDHVLSQGADAVMYSASVCQAQVTELIDKFERSTVMISWDRVLFYLLVGMVIVEFYHGAKDVIDRFRQRQSGDDLAEARRDKKLWNAAANIVVCVLAIIPVLFYGVETVLT